MVGMLQHVSAFPSTELGVAFRKYQQQGQFTSTSAYAVSLLLSVGSYQDRLCR